MEEEPDFSHLPSLKDAMQLRPLLAKAGQKVYDEWTQDEDGYDEEYGNGGICHVIADAMVDVLYKLPGLEIAGTVSATDEVHVYIVAQFSDGVFIINIPWHYYERGGGYTWTKLADVEFTPDFVHFSHIDSDPAKVATYLDDDG